MATLHARKSEGQLFLGEKWNNDDSNTALCGIELVAVRDTPNHSDRYVLPKGHDWAQGSVGPAAGVAEARNYAPVEFVFSEWNTEPTCTSCRTALGLPELAPEPVKPTRGKR